MITTTAQKRGFTLLEILIVVVLLGLSIIPLVFGARQAQLLQSLRTSAAVLADDVALAKISARDAKDQVAWGVESTDKTHYQTISGSASNKKVAQVHNLEKGISFPANFSVWFDVGTGGTDQDLVIEVESESGQKLAVTISKNGVIQTKKL